MQGGTIDGICEDLQDFRRKAISEGYGLLAYLFKEALDEGSSIRTNLGVIDELIEYPEK